MVFPNLPVLLGPYTAIDDSCAGRKVFSDDFVGSWRPKCRAFSCFFRWSFVLCASEDIFNVDEACKVGGPDKLLPLVPRVFCPFLTMACCHLFGAPGDECYLSLRQLRGERSEAEIQHHSRSIATVSSLGQETALDKRCGEGWEAFGSKARPTVTWTTPWQRMTQARRHGQ